MYIYIHTHTYIYIYTHIICETGTAGAGGVSKVVMRCALSALRFSQA